MLTVLVLFNVSNCNLQARSNPSHDSDDTYRTFSSYTGGSDMLWTANWKPLLYDLLKWVTFKTSVQNWHQHKWSTSKNRFLLVYVMHVLCVTMRSAISWESVSSSCKESDAVSYLECLFGGGNVLRDVSRNMLILITCCPNKAEYVCWSILDKARFKVKIILWSSRL